VVARSPTDLVAMPPSLLPLSLPTVRRALAPSLASPTFGPAAAMEPGVRLAGVCAVLREVPGDVEVLVIRRGEREGDPWSGHMALPGGRFEPEDVSVYTTAVRETHEEVGIDLSDAELLGSLDDVPSPPLPQGKRAHVSPFVLALRSVPELRLHPREVREALWLPLGRAHRGDFAATHPYVYTLPDGGRVDLAMPAFDLDGRVIWGMTHRILTNLLERVEAQL
jgi:8-oxo-dGTP pyrophosphatase MutT (NUDIX family)